MSQRDDVLRILARQPTGMTDVQVTRELKRLHPAVRHQTANQLCRGLAAEGLVIRDDADRPIINRLATGAGAPAVRPRARSMPTLERPWPWEGAVQAAVVRWLEQHGAAVRSQANTAARERGTDVVAEWNGRVVHVEVKGWPSENYADPARAHQRKPTPPTLQAGHWFAGAVSSALKLREAHPDDRVAIALPDKPRYRRLQEERRGVLEQIGVEVWFVDESRMTMTGPD